MLSMLCSLAHLTSSSISLCISGFHFILLPYRTYASSRELKCLLTPLNEVQELFIIANAGYSSNSSFPKVNEHLYKFFTKFLFNCKEYGSNSSPFFAILQDLRRTSFSCKDNNKSLRLTPACFRVLIQLRKSSSLFSSCKISKTLTKNNSAGINLYLSKSEISSSNVNVKFFKQFKGKCYSHYISKPHPG